MPKKIITCLLCVILVFAAGFLSSYIITEKRNRANIGEYENRLAVVTNLNRQLQDENRRASEINTSLTKRLDEITGRLGRASEIVTGFKGQTASDGETIQRLIDYVSVLEKAFGVIFKDN